MVGRDDEGVLLYLRRIEFLILTRQPRTGIAASWTACFAGDQLAELLRVCLERRLQARAVWAGRAVQEALHFFWYGRDAPAAGEYWIAPLKAPEARVNIASSDARGTPGNRQKKIPKPLNRVTDIVRAGECCKRHSRIATFPSPPPGLACS